MWRIIRQLINHSLGILNLPRWWLRLLVLPERSPNMAERPPEQIFPAKRQRYLYF
jgi:hypothetical protein